MHTATKICERLTELMSERNIDNKTLANAIHVSEESIGRWKNGKGQFKLSNALKLAEYFGCSLDFLTGRSEMPIDFIPHTCADFYTHFRRILSEKGVSRNRINRDTHIKSSHFADWKKGCDPHIDSLIQLADYMDITLDILVGRDQ